MIEKKFIHTICHTSSHNVRSSLNCCESSIKSDCDDKKILHFQEMDSSFMCKVFYRILHTSDDKFLKLKMEQLLGQYVFFKEK